MEITKSISVISLKTTSYLTLPKEVRTSINTQKAYTATFIIDDATKELVGLKDIKPLNKEEKVAPKEETE
jgi:hypothetical protein